MAKTEVFQKHEATVIYNPESTGGFLGIIIDGKNVTHFLYNSDEGGSAELLRAAIKEKEQRGKIFETTTPQGNRIVAIPCEILGIPSPISLEKVIRGEKTNILEEVFGLALDAGLHPDVIKEMKKYFANYRHPARDEDIKEWRSGPDSDNLRGH